MVETTVQCAVKGFTGDRDNFDLPKVVRRTDARLTPSSFDCLFLIILLLLLVMVGMWLMESVLTGDVDDEFVNAVVLTTT